MTRMELPTLDESYFICPTGKIFNHGVEIEPFKWGKQKNGTGDPYLGVALKGKLYLLHRIIALKHVPNPDPRRLKQVNHIDQDIYNNSVQNLEWVSHGENRSHSKRNEHRTNGAKYKGVYKHNQKWRVQIRKDGKMVYRKGGFLKQRDAAIHYNDVIHRYHHLGILNDIIDDDE